MWMKNVVLKEVDEYGTPMTKRVGMDEKRMTNVAYFPSYP